MLEEGTIVEALELEELLDTELLDEGRLDETLKLEEVLDGGTEDLEILEE
jgi:hypothetical protein